ADSRILSNADSGWNSGKWLPNRTRSRPTRCSIRARPPTPSTLRGMLTPHSRGVHDRGRATSLPGRVVPNGHAAAGPSAADEIADDQLGPAVPVQIAGSTRQMITRFRLQGVAHELPRSDLFQQDDGV